MNELINEWIKEWMNKIAVEKSSTWKSTSLQKYIYSLFTVHQKSKTIRFKKKVLLFRVNNDTETSQNEV